MRGLVREVLGLGAWVGAIFAAVWALPRVRPQFQQWLGTSPWVDPVAFGAVFVVALIVLMLDLPLDQRPGARARRSAALTARWVWYSASRGVPRCWSSPISSLGWWSRSIAGRMSCCRPARCRWSTRAPPGSCEQIAGRPHGRSSTRRPRVERPRPMHLLHATPQGRATGKPPVRNQESTHGTNVAAHRCLARPPVDSPTPSRTTFPRPSDDKLHEECGVFGVWNVPDAAAVTALGLHALQHRGQEATGIVTYDGKHFHSHRGLGLVGDNFSDPRVMAVAARHHRHRPQPLCHHRRHHPAQRPAAVRRFRVRRLRGGA